MAACTNQRGCFYFLYGYGGTGKTFTWNALSATLRTRGEIILIVASSGITAILLLAGRTTHSRFSIPLNISEESMCNFQHDSPIAELLKHTKIIIWDEAPMVKRQCFEALDCTLKDLLRFDLAANVNQPFVGKIVVLGKDFRQILHFIPQGTRAYIIHASITSSYLWAYCQLLTLTRNMRLCNDGTSKDIQEVKEFLEWILSVGNGDISEPYDGEVEIDIPQEFLILDFVDPIEAILSQLIQIYLITTMIQSILDRDPS